MPEGLLAVRAGVGFHPGVDPHVLGQIAGVSERLRAVRTLVGFGFSVVSVQKHKQGKERRKKRGRERDRLRPMAVVL